MKKFLISLIVTITATMMLTNVIFADGHHPVMRPTSLEASTFEQYLPSVDED